MVEETRVEMTSLNKDEFGRLDGKSLYIDNGHEMLINMGVDPATGHWFEYEDVCHDADQTPRCMNIQNDQDAWGFDTQCSLWRNHDGECQFGGAGILWYLGPKEDEPRCTEDEHVGTCSVCLVREVRGR